jgi:tetratricopeptide (TPR) repeat protein
MIYRMRGALLSRLGRNEQALADFDAAARLDPKNAQVFKDRGGVYNRLGRYAEGLRDLTESIRLDPKNARAYQNRAASYNGLGRYDRAVADCDEALRLDPNCSGALNNRGLAWVGLGRDERAVVDLTESIRLDPGQVAAYLNRGSAFARLGRSERAAADYDEAFRRSPKLALAYSGVGRAPDLLRVPARPAATDGPALRLSPSEAAQAVEQGHALRAAGDWPGAVAAFTRAIEADPRNAEAYALRGWSRLCDGATGADGDSRAWFGLLGWHDPFAPYMALLGVLAARHDGRHYAAAAYLDDALAHAQSGTWPFPVFAYLKGRINAAELLAAGDTPKKRTEAHAVIGLDLLGRGDRAAVEHLSWARDRGVDRSIARDLAREALRRSTDGLDFRPGIPDPVRTGRSRGAAGLGVSVD